MAIDPNAPTLIREVVYTPPSTPIYYTPLPEDLVANPLCSIDIYPYEGGQYSLTGAQVLQCSVTKNLEILGGLPIYLLPPGVRMVKDFLLGLK